MIPGFECMDVHGWLLETLWKEFVMRTTITWMVWLVLVLVLVFFPEITPENEYVLEDVMIFVMVAISVIPFGIFMNWIFLGECAVSREEISD